ncbi:phosphatase PAP2 family protein [Saccharomonospora cyanea]|uniref:Membrane-associated phospholipid phosphatase n=1 Tax=Saccharomonospora cyanea NA-134 TaxID=882082 RepID=H5XGK3_9PSEU|nr:phosphatase PAP2 family protein [Saccharomonospora cyanea]EHR60542.1 membrane-associated phospholipid phosphatase [Saccharomonospora cyanea NA-134]
MPFPVPEAVPVTRSTPPAAPDGQAGQEEVLEVDGVPDLSAEWYRAVLDAANAAPGWLGDFAVFFTEAGVVVLGLLLVFGWWQARRGSAGAMAAAVFAPVATLFAYGISELAKLVIEQDRPCRAVPGARPLTECPELGDWSFPSNHSTIAGGAAMAVFLCRRGAVGVAALCLGALVAFSRVVVGVHYPHDVLVGFTLGVAVVAAVMTLAARWTTRLVETYRPHQLFGLLLGPGATQVALPRTADPVVDTDPVEDTDDDTRVLVATRASVDEAPTRPIPRTPHWPSGNDQRRRLHGPRPPRAPRPPRRR